MAKFATFDKKEFDAFFARLGGPGRESLARRMGVAGGRVFRDEAKLRAPKGVAEEQAQRQFGGSIHPGALENAIYVAYDTKLSHGTQYAYSVSWNARLAPHGHLLEFGHWQPYLVVFSPKLGWITNPKVRLPGNGKWVPAHPFLRPTLDSASTRAKEAIIAAGKRELPKVLAGE